MDERKYGPPEEQDSKYESKIELKPIFKGTMIEGLYNTSLDKTMSPETQSVVHMFDGTSLQNCKALLFDDYKVRHNTINTLIYTKDYQFAADYSFSLEDKYQSEYIEYTKFYLIFLVNKGYIELIDDQLLCNYCKFIDYTTLIYKSIEHYKTDFITDDRGLFRFNFSKKEKKTIEQKLLKILNSDIGNKCNFKIELPNKYGSILIFALRFKFDDFVLKLLDYGPSKSNFNYIRTITYEYSSERTTDFFFLNILRDNKIDIINKVLDFNKSCLNLDNEEIIINIKRCVHRCKYSDTPKKYIKLMKFCKEILPDFYEQHIKLFLQDLEI